MSKTVSHTFDLAAVRDRLEKYVRRVSADRNVRAIVLFGSLVSEDYAAGSDVDLLVVLDTSDLPFHERLTDYVTAELGVAADVFVYTVGEVEQMIAEDRGIPAVALRDGEVLFRRESWAVPGLGPVTSRG